MKLATLCYVRSRGKTLMIHRIKKQDDMHAGKWNGLGGKLEPGESPEDCVVREVREESGLLVQNPELRGVLTFPRFSKDEDWYVFVFVAESFTGVVIDSQEGVLQWIENERLLELNLWAGDRTFIPWLDHGAFFSGKFVYNDGALHDYEAFFYPSEPRSLSRQRVLGADGSALEASVMNSESVFAVSQEQIVNRSGAN